MTELAFAHGGPPLSGRLRVSPEDFEVEEILGFEADGHGEHALLWIEKREANTEWVARQLAAFAGVAPLAVGFSGLKDRHALTRQAFSVQLPGRADPDWSALQVQDVRVLEARRHSRKLKRGVHAGNRFRIRLHEVQGSRAETDRRLGAIAAHGVPNYFGEQRFGRGGENLRAARALFSGARMHRSQRAFALSAARSHLFNRALDQRVSAGSWNRALDGEVWMLAGSHSIFGPQPLDDILLQRLLEFDIDPTGPLWGRGELRSAAQVAELEEAVAASDPTLAQGLAGEGLRQERRSLRLRAEGLRHSWAEDRSLLLEFTLPSGAFATSVVRELCAYASVASGSSG
ncbi:tRNA pseudouridine(13) synthase TruD [Dokdonella immobilis]|uniref:tRNA pseudouridine synthase D n=1 Tax=Dokdonella immobilis TaxID=578942 RepID=A0A1I4V4X5_9GAMM|nr:tRNA pseudouridine(13) synthase TruD [Dokdonella immobilis]SFM96218.1 tRNA pseudouridine13 synthase [Dokdonella immobilis]